MRTRLPAFTRFRWPAGVAVVALAAAACSTTGSAATDTHGLTGTPIKIGVLANVSGPTGASEASATKVFQAWAAHTNQAGGIGGHPVQVVVKDTKEDAPAAAAAARSLISDSSIAAVVAASTSTDAAVGSILADSGLPVTGGIGYNPTVWGKLKNWFGLTTTFPQVVNMQIASAQPVGGSAISVVACAEEPACVAAVPLFEAAAKAAGKTYSGTMQVAAASPNYTAQCLDLVNRKVNFVQLSISPAVGVRVVKDCQAQGYAGYFGSSASAISPTLYRTANIRLAGALNAFPWWADTAPVKAYRAAMSEQGVSDDDAGQPASTAMWASGELFKKALTSAAGKASDPVTRQTVLGAYGKVKGETLDGLLPQPITFTAGQPAPPVNCYWLYQYQNGAFAGSAQPTCPS
ncbi:branched-chain amino acid ABC transporter periplasmic protein [Amycolatopsis mediterranei S699]|uniref:Periplasmic substrate-binding component of ABC-type branched-chain amino acid transport system n=3 Tax=Amycolatopsis mediterranei TaxID=33910 RepID=A0A0H3D5N7_AMYMU|nr:ABC transporter substrate-binding protein [Amycolatopsis mediterranei]ADJ45602.1 periplasmic substrate-binding component of ABC-type branched-chain amino acid transport system [Amycolatopsis mediterranei U32]AEK42381.1 branched-chain amino acid ABC transporter periplasmic protein [Amycolatopsis mediterranei S699]AFO77314.1 branched-chain amino acid ABC transporter periplasmic protein [Amycolatopsis mediterranei S699]AGT84442.1 branched-chain amino acid ABC transporter periplasmic protein [Am